MEFKQRQKQADKQEQVFTEVNESKSLFETEHKQKHLEETDTAQKEEKAEFISQGFRESTMNDDIDELGGGAPEEPQYIGMEKKFIKSQQDDSDRMTAVREALDVYHHPEQNKMNKQQALDHLIKACDKYSTGRFRIFKWGRGKQRLKEVLALRDRAMQEKERVKEELRSAGTPELIYNDAVEGAEDRRMNEIAGASLGKRLMGKVAAVFGVTVINALKVLTLQPLWREKVSWRPETYKYHTVKFLDRVFGRQKLVEKVGADGQVIEGEYDTITRQEKSHSLKEKINSKTLQAEEAQMKSYEAMKERGDFDDFDEDEYMDHEYANEERLRETKQLLLEEYKKETRNQKAIDHYEKVLKEQQLRANKFEAYMKQYKPHVGFSLDDHFDMDAELFKARLDHARINEREVERNMGGHLGQLAGQQNNFSVAVVTDWVKDEWLTGEKVPEEVVEKQIEEAYRICYGTEIGEKEKEKLKKDFQKRFDESVRASKAFQQYYYYSQDNMPRSKNAGVKTFKENKQDDLFRDLLNVVCIMKDKTTEDKEKYIRDIGEAETKSEQAGLLKPVIEKAFEMKDFSKFEYKDDEEMLVKYNLYADEFNYGFVLSKMTDHYIELGGELTKEQLDHCKAVAYTLQSIKTVIENRIHIIASPYYSTFGDQGQELIKLGKEEYNEKYDERSAATNEYLEDYLDSRQIAYKESKSKRDSSGYGAFHGDNGNEMFKLTLEKVKQKGLK